MPGHVGFMATSNNRHVFRTIVTGFDIHDPLQIHCTPQLVTTASTARKLPGYLYSNTFYEKRFYDFFFLLFRFVSTILKKRGGLMFIYKVQT